MHRSASAILGAVVASWSVPVMVFGAPAITAPDSGAVEPAAAAPDSARLASLSADLAGTRWARVTGAGRQFELTEPRAGAMGLDYGRAKGFPTTRPALIVGQGGERPASPPHPVRWSSIDRIEVQQQRWGVGAPLGAGLGLWGGYLLGGTLAWAVYAGTHSTFAWVATLVAVPIGGGVLGAYSLGSRSDWAEVYPARATHGQDTTATSTRAPARRP